MKETLIKGEFLVSGDYFDIPQLTGILNITPTESHYKGDKARYNFKGYPDTAWWYILGKYPPSKFSHAYERLEEILAPVKDEYFKFLERNKAEGQLGVVVDLVDYELNLSIPRDIMRFLHEMKIEYATDIYFCHEEIPDERDVPDEEVDTLMLVMKVSGAGIDTVAIEELTGLKCTYLDVETSVAYFNTDIIYTRSLDDVYEPIVEKLKPNLAGVSSYIEKNVLEVHFYIEAESHDYSQPYLGLGLDMIELLFAFKAGINMRLRVFKPDYM